MLLNICTIHILQDFNYLTIYILQADIGQYAKLHIGLGLVVMFYPAVY